MTGEQGDENRSSIPQVGTEVWGRSRPRNVKGAVWVKIGFGDDPWHPQMHTGWRLEEKPPKEKPQSDMNVKESVTGPMPKIVKGKGKKGWWGIGNYNADLADPDRDK